jgi:diketogulonate reductase-like aldo/keto reductase
MRPIAEAHGLTMLQLACAWNLSQPAVQSVIPTLIQEVEANSKTIESKVDELASLPNLKLSADECAAIAEIGNNKGCMDLKGANRSHMTVPEADRWGLTPDLEAVGKRWGINPDQDLVNLHSKAA